MAARQVEQDRDEQAYEDVAERLHLLSLPSRLRIVDLLRYREECVCNLQDALGRSQTYVSQQLHVLRKAGIIERHRGGRRKGGDGRFVYYRLVDPWAERLVEAALGPAEPPAYRKTGPAPEGDAGAQLDNADYTNPRGDI